MSRGNLERGVPTQCNSATARDMQDNIREDLNEAWPRCPTHQYGMHPGVTDQTPVWWCHYGDGHPVSEIGLLPGGETD